MTPFERILMPTDGSDHGAAALARGFELARLLKRPVVGLYVIDSRALEPYPRETLVVDLAGILAQEAKKALDAFQARAKKAGLACETRILRGLPEEEIIKAARPDDLIVLATHGRRGLRRLLLGSVTETVVREAPCPVLVVRHGK